MCVCFLLVCFLDKVSLTFLMQAIYTVFLCFLFSHVSHVSLSQRHHIDIISLTNHIKP